MEGGRVLFFCFRVHACCSILLARGQTRQAILLRNATSDTTLPHPGPNPKRRSGRIHRDWRAQVFAVTSALLVPSSISATRRPQGSACPSFLRWYRPHRPRTPTSNLSFSLKHRDDLTHFSLTVDCMFIVPRGGRLEEERLRILKGTERRRRRGRRICWRLAFGAGARRAESNSGR
jgi:hypothetical protein